MSSFGRSYANMSSNWMVGYYNRSGWWAVHDRLRSPAAHALAYPLVLLFEYHDNIPPAVAGRDEDVASTDEEIQPRKKSRLKDHANNNVLAALIMTDHSRASTAEQGRQSVVQNLVLLQDDTNGGLAFSQAAKHSNERFAELAKILGPVVATCMDKTCQKEPGHLIQGICDAAIENKSVFFQSKGMEFCRTPIQQDQIGKYEYEDFHPGKFDLILGDANKELLALFMVRSSQSNKMWWSKMRASMECLDNIAAQKYDSIKISSSRDTPALLSHLTYCEDSHRFQMAVFLCWHTEVSTKHYGNQIKRRMVLVREQQGTVQHDLAGALASVLAVAETLQVWRNIKVDEGSFDILGPHCTKVRWRDNDDQSPTNKVLRFYDARLRPIEESAAVYFNEAMFEPKERGVLLTRHTRPENEREYICREDWVWKCKGQLEVILVPYWTGNHEAKRLTDFLPIVRQLSKLHNLGLVHGDIRGLNIIYNGGNGRLIDFDFSGKLGEARYPKGYKGCLGDGRRLGHECNVIAVRDDWHALTEQIFTSYHWDPPSGDSQEEDEAFRKLFASRHVHRNFKDAIRAKDVGERLEPLVKDLVGMLTQFDEEGWTCQADWHLSQVLNGED